MVSSRRTKQVQKPRQQPEETFKARVILLAIANGWKVMHINPAFVGGRRITPTNEGGVGFPDLVLARNGVVHCWELKAEGARADKAAQREWIEALDGKFLWPKDWDWIQEVLK